MTDQFSTAELAGIHDSLRKLAAIAAQSPAPQSSVEIESAIRTGYVEPRPEAAS